MKTLAITLCLLFAMAPARAQQMFSRPAPNFYVPYGVRDVPLGAMELESSSSDMRIAYSGQFPGAQRMPHYPARRRGYRRYGQGRGPNLQQPPQFSTGAMIAGLVAVGVALAVVAAGDH